MGIPFFWSCRCAKCRRRNRKFHYRRTEKDGAFKSISDLLERIDSKGLNSRACESLIRCGAMDSFGYNRRQLIEVLPQALNNASVTRSDRESGQLSLFGGEIKAKTIVYPDLPDMSAAEKIDSERKLLGFYVSGHPLILISSR